MVTVIAMLVVFPDDESDDNDNDDNSDDNDDDENRDYDNSDENDEDDDSDDNDDDSDGDDQTMTLTGAMMIMMMTTRTRTAWGLRLMCEKASCHWLHLIRGSGPGPLLPFP